MIQVNFLNEQIIYDAFHLSKPHFVELLLKMFPEMNEIEARVIQSGITTEFEYWVAGLRRTNTLDPLKLAEFKKKISIGLSEEEKSLIENKGNDPMDIGLHIMVNDIDYKWKSDKIKALIKNDYNDDQIMELFKGKLDRGYIKQFRK